MALRHWGGSIPQKNVVWHCPSCHAENLGPLERGCTQCGAGDPAKSGKVDTVPPVPLPTTTGAQLYGQPAPDPLVVAHDWAAEFCLQVVDGRYSQARIAEIAFLAGVEWARRPQGQAPAAGVGGTVHPEAAPPTSGYSLIMVPPDADGVTVENTPAVDPRTHATIVAALAFYKDNQLGYGDIPGQLTAAECGRLIEQLQDPEPETKA